MPQAAALVLTHLAAVRAASLSGKDSDVAMDKPRLLVSVQKKLSTQFVESKMSRLVRF